MQRKRRWGIPHQIWLPICSIALVVFLMEIAAFGYFYFFKQAEFGPRGGSTYLTLPDAELGWKAPENASFQSSAYSIQGDLLYDIAIRTDEFGRRIVKPSSPSASVAQEKDIKHLILFGDSFAFGTGLPDRQTLQFKLGELLPQFSIYNYSVYGYGPQHTLKLLQRGQIPQQVQPKKGLAIYVLIPDHFDRLVASTRQ